MADRPQTTSRTLYFIRRLVAAGRSVAVQARPARVVGAVLVIAGAMACEGGRDGAPATGLDWENPPPPVGGGVAPTDRGACEEEGAVVPCGKVVERFDDYVTCSEGTRTCVDGKWSECIGTRITQKPAATGAVGTRLLALGTPTVCPAGFDACDPYCNNVVDAPGGFTSGGEISYDTEKFNNTTTGITPTATGVGNCTQLQLTVAASTPLVDGKWLVTGLSPLTATPSNPLRFTLEALPAGCATEAFETTWGMDKVDRASISGTTNEDGELSLAVPIAGNIRVTAFAKGLVASLDVPVAVRVTQTSSVNPNTGASAGDLAHFGPATAPLTGTINSTATWLYPYDGTYFPLGLPAPVLQYRYSSTCGNGKAVKYSLRYPTGQTATSADFNYSIIVREGNNASVSLASEGANTLDPQVIIPQAAWANFEQTARGDEAELIVQRLRSGVPAGGGCNSTVTLERESKVTIRFVNGQLKGTVFYNSYTSPLGGSIGAVLKISPGATAPTIAVQPTHNGNASGTRKCTVCHTLGLDGKSLIANTDLTGMSPSVSGGVKFNNSRRFDMTASNPSSTVVSTYTPSPSGDAENPRGDRYTYGAPWLNGSHYMTHGGNDSYGGDSNWRAPNDYSNFFRLATGHNPSDTLNTVVGWKDISAVTPRFSPDGRRLAFAFWGSSSSTLPCSSNAIAPCTTGSNRKLSPASGGTRLAVVDFDRPANTNSTTGWLVTNARDLTPGVTDRVAWPTFTPDGSAVAYQRQIRAPLLSWSASKLNSVGGALGEIWLSDVRSDGSHSSTPTRLLALNGLDASCATDSTTCTSTYLPTVSRTVSPPTSYHNNSSFTVYVPDTCGASATANNVNDYQLNYLPSFNPTETGGHRWLIFSSRRMYGNIAYGHPWDAEPGMSCKASNTPSTKKLWVSAIDKTWTPGKDPSHPAFYLPGQELKAGNSNAYWVNAECTPEGSACSTNDDCCGGTGDDPTAKCKVVGISPLAKECAAIGGECSAVGGECSTSDDCCTGLTCPEGGGTCLNVPVPIFETQSLQREYVVDCPHGTNVKWRHFEWQATTPTGTSIDFSVQTKDDAADPYAPMIPLAIASASGISNPAAWYRGAQTTDQVLTAAGLFSRSRLLVTMTFNPDAAGSAAPVLHAWRHIYDCVPSE